MLGAVQGNCEPCSSEDGQEELKHVFSLPGRCLARCRSCGYYKERRFDRYSTPASPYFVRSACLQPPPPPNGVDVLAHPPPDEFLCLSVTWITGHYLRSMKMPIRFLNERRQMSSILHLQGCKFQPRLPSTKKYTSIAHTRHWWTVYSFLKFCAYGCPGCPGCGCTQIKPQLLLVCPEGSMDSNEYVQKHKSQRKK
jgi:hypothetical protein